MTTYSKELLDTIKRLFDFIKRSSFFLVVTFCQTHRRQQDVGGDHRRASQGSDRVRQAQDRQLRLQVLELFLRGNPMKELLT